MPVPHVVIQNRASVEQYETVGGPLPLPRAQRLAESMAAADGWYAGNWSWDSLTAGLWRLLGHRNLANGLGENRPAKLLQATGYVLVEPD